MIKRKIQKKRRETQEIIEDASTAGMIADFF